MITDRFFSRACGGRSIDARDWRAWLVLPLVLTLPTSLVGRARAQPLAASSAATPAPTPAAPADECVGDRFIVLVERGFEAALAVEVRADFAAELAHRGLAICDAESTTRAPSAVIDVEAKDAVVVIQLDDRVTHKRVERDLSLQGIPANGRALTIAIAIDELLRASWAELTLRRARDDGSEEEEDESYSMIETRPVNARGRGRSRGHTRERTRFQLGVDLDYLHTARNFDAFALDLRGSVHPWGWGWFELSLGGLGSVPTHSAEGDVIAAGFRTALTTGACSRARSRWFSCAGVHTEVDALRLRGTHARMAQAQRSTAAVVQTSLVGLLAVTLERSTYLFGELGLGAVLQGAEATRGTNTLMGITGLLLSLSLGVGYEL